MIIEALVLAVLVRFNSPFLCAFVYGCVQFAWLMLSGNRLDKGIVQVGISFGVALVFFWVLKRFEDRFLWWVVLVGGLAAWVFFRLLPVMGA